MSKYPEFPIGSRVTVSNWETLESFKGSDLPTVGWVVGQIERVQGRQHLGWDYLIEGDWHPHPFLDHPMRFPDFDLSMVHLRRHTRQIRYLPAMDCPWCLKHGRDPRLPELYVPHLPDCQCWHHTHDEHMPACPFRV